MNAAHRTTAVLCLALVAPALPAADRPPIIDMHLHAHFPHAPHIAAGAPPICRPDPCHSDGAATASSAESLEKTLAQMKRYNIVKGFLSSPDLNTVDEWVAAAPGRFLGAPFILKPGQFEIAALRRDLRAGRLAGLGEIGTQLNGIPPDDPALEPYFALAEELDVPVLIHTLGIGPRLPDFRSQAGNPLLLEHVLVRHPKLRIYVENSGYPFLAEMVAIMNQYPQVYGDLSTITWVLPRTAFYDYLEGLLRAGLGQRLMFGSDQMRWPEMIGQAVEAIEAAPFLSEAQRRDIFYDNAARFLRLRDERAEVTSSRGVAQ